MNHNIMQDKWKIRLRQFRYIPLIYFVLAIFLIYVSDRVVFFVFKDANSVQQMTTYKNLFFVIVTTAVLYYAIRVLANSLDKSHDMVMKIFYYDELTSSVTRKIFIDRIERLLALSERTRFCFGLILVDIDNFKGINDAYGHLVGDKILIETARRLSTITRKSDTVSRFGGDEFLILAPETKCHEGLGRIKEKLNDAFAPPFCVDGNHNIKVSFSVGGALFSDNGKTLDELIKFADDDMHQVKKPEKRMERI